MTAPDESATNTDVTGRTRSARNLLAREMLEGYDWTWDAMSHTFRLLRDLERMHSALLVQWMVEREMLRQAGWECAVDGEDFRPGRHHRIEDHKTNCGVRVVRSLVVQRACLDSHPVYRWAGHDNHIAPRKDTP